MNRVKMDSRVNGNYLAVNREKRERQAQTLEGTDKCLSSVWHFRRTLVGIAHQQATLCICPVVHVRCEKYKNVGCLNAFPFVPLKPHSRQPSLRGVLLGLATREVSQAGESARTLSGRYSLGFLLANPLPCHSLRLVPRV